MANDTYPANEKDKINKLYSYKIGSDRREEAFADFIANNFINNFKTNLTTKAVFPYEISDIVKDAINNVFKSDMDKTVKDLILGKLGNTTLSNWFSVFESGLFDFNSVGKTRINVILSQELSTVKSRIVEENCV